MVFVWYRPQALPDCWRHSTQHTNRSIKVTDHISYYYYLSATKVVLSSPSFLFLSHLLFLSVLLLSSPSVPPLSPLLVTSSGLFSWFRLLVFFPSGLILSPQLVSPPSVLSLCPLLVSPPSVLSLCPLLVSPPSVLSLCPLLKAQSAQSTHSVLSLW